MKRKIIGYLILVLLSSSCAALKKNRTIDKVQFVYDTSAEINYGYTLPIRMMVIYTDGKEKNITTKKGTTITVSGANYRKGKIYIDGYPSEIGDNTIRVNGNYVLEEKTYTTQTIIPFNYKGDLNLDFSGDNGEDGNNGDDKSTSLLFRNGNDGEIGEDGKIGENGSDLTVNIWKENDGTYRVKVIDLISNETFRYIYQDNGYGIRFDVRGGNGGNGGQGGDGGNGKDGEIKKGKKKDVGNGGNGGNGGNAGSGGNGGNVYIFLHPNAKELKDKIAVLNLAGSPGEPGKPGEGGDAGTPLEGQSSPSDGVDGVVGNPGLDGLNGEPFHLIIEDFDIEY